MTDDMLLCGACLDLFGENKMSGVRTLLVRARTGRASWAA